MVDEALLDGLEEETDNENVRVVEGSWRPSETVTDLRYVRGLSTEHIIWSQPEPLSPLDDVLPLELREKGSQVIMNLTGPGHDIGKTMWSIALCGLKGLIEPYPGVSPKTVIVTKDRPNRGLEAEGIDEVVKPEVFTKMAEARKFLCVWERHYPKSSRAPYRMGIRIDYLVAAINSVDGERNRACFSFLNPVALAGLNFLLTEVFVPTFWLVANTEDREAMLWMGEGVKHAKKERKARKSEDLGQLGVGGAVKLAGRVVLQNRCLHTINDIPVETLPELDRIRAVVPWLREGLNAPLLPYEREAFKRGAGDVVKRYPGYPRITRKELVEGIMFRTSAIVRGRRSEYESGYPDEPTAPNKGCCLYRPAIPVDWNDPSFRPSG